MQMYRVKNHIFPLPKEIQENGEIKIGSISNAKVHIEIEMEGAGALIESAVKEIENALLKIAAVYPSSEGWALCLFQR